MVRVKIKKKKRKEKHILRPSRERGKLWKMWVTVLPVAIGAFGTASKILERGWKSWKSEDEWRPSKLQQFMNTEKSPEDLR